MSTEYEYELRIWCVVNRSSVPVPHWLSLRAGMQRCPSYSQLPCWERGLGLNLYAFSDLGMKTNLHFDFALWISICALSFSLRCLAHRACFSFRSLEMTTPHPSVAPKANAASNSSIAQSQAHGQEHDVFKHSLVRFFGYANEVSHRNLSLYVI